MKNDFMIGESGDLIFVPSTINKEELTLNFYTMPSNCLTVNFFIKNRFEFKHLKNLEPSLIINFNVDTVNYCFDTLIANDQDYMQQQITIRLKTALGTLTNNEDIGSTIDMYKHNIIKKKDKFDKLK